MTFELRILVVGLAAFAAVGTLAALCAWLWARGRTSRLLDSALLVLRMLPTVSALLALALTMLAFALFEQRGHEATGLVLRSLAVLGAALIIHAGWRAWRLHRRTRQSLSQWMATAEPVALPGIDLPIFAVHSTFPVVAVVGLIRQRIVIARSVLDGCEPEELRAILAHEQMHIDRHDNVRRAILATAPDVLSWFPVSERLLAAWHDRCEESADNGAERLGERGRVLLAQALIRVARLAAAPPSIHDLPASALYRGEDLRRRVHRLLAPPAAAAAPSRWGRYLAALAVTASTMALRPIHDLVEAAVTWLP
jgi:Zn-dependent protease with chaperone function